MRLPTTVRSLLFPLAVAGLCGCGGGGASSPGPSSNGATSTIPFFGDILKFQARTKQSEAKANLKAMYTAEKAFFAEKDRFSTNINEVGFSPERNNRYRYVLTSIPHSLEDRSGIVPVGHSTDEGIGEDAFKYSKLLSSIEQGSCSGSPVWGISNNGQTFTGAAYGDIDGDGTLDVWTISTESRTLGGDGCDAGTTVPAGEPVNEINDVNR